MIPYDIDPSLHDHEPGAPVLDDGFSPPAQQPAALDRDDEDATTGSADLRPRRTAR